MSQKQDNLIVVLDIGSAWTRVLAADLNEGALRYRGHGVVESAGMRKGLISDLPPAAKAVKAAIERAEWVARANFDELAVGVGGPHIRGLNTNGGLDLGSRMREITSEDARAALDRARAVERPPDREILHLLPRQFILDDQPGIFDPVGMVGARLEVDLHIATSGIFVPIKDLLECLAAIEGPEDPSLLVRPVGMAGNGDEEPIRIFRIHGELGNLLSIPQSQVGPGFSCVG